MYKRNKLVANPALKGARKVVERVTEGGFPKDSTVVYKERRNELRRFPAPEIEKIEAFPPAGAPAPDCRTYEVNVKAFQLPRFPNNIVYRTFRHSKARRSYENALMLRRMGFLTPEPVGFSEEHLGLGLSPRWGIYPSLRRSYYFCQHLHLPNIRCWENRPDLTEFVAAFAAEIHRLHTAGVWFLDFSPGNILVNKTPEGKFEFYYVDLNRAQFGVRDPRKLMQMFKSISWTDDFIALLAEAYGKEAGIPPEISRKQALEAADTWRRGLNKKNLFKRIFGIDKLQKRKIEKIKNHK